MIHNYNIQNDIERLKDQILIGKITVEQANVEMIIIERVRLICNKIPINIRKALNEAVKNKILGHMKKEGLMPECYYYLSFKDLANKKRRMYKEEKEKILKKNHEILSKNLLIVHKEEK